MIIGDGSPEVRGELRKTLFRKEKASSIVFETGAEPLRLKDNRGGRPKTLFSLQDKKQNKFKPGRVILLKNKEKTTRSDCHSLHHFIKPQLIYYSL